LVRANPDRDLVRWVTRLLTLCVALAGVVWFCACANAQPLATGAASGRVGWLDWNGPNFFGPCRGDCALSLYGGKEVTSSMERIFFVKHPPTPAWDWRWRSTYLAAGTFSRRLVGFWNLISIGPELGVGASARCTRPSCGPR
jgi:hypothetical protein